MKERISLFIPSFNGGGAEKTMIFLSNAFANKGYDVDLITLKSGGVYTPFIQENVNIIEFKRERILHSLPSLIRYFKQRKPKAFISAMSHVNFASIIAKLLSREKSKLIISVRNITSRSIQTKFKRYKTKLLIKLLYPYSDKIVCISSAVADDLIKHFSVDKQNVTVINNPVIYPDIYIKSDENISIKRDGNETLILSVGRLESVKNFSILIRAVKKLIDEGNTIKLIIFGEGSQRNYLEKLVSELNMTHYISMPGFKPNIYPYYKKADLFVLPSISEGLGNVLIEAMAFGLPVIAAKDSGGPDEILEGGKFGELFNNNDFIDLSIKIKKMMLNNNQKKIYKGISKYEIDSIASQYEKLIKKG